MNGAPTSRVLLDNSDHIGHAYVELFDDGRVRAGYYKDTAKPYESAEEALTHFQQSYSFSNNPSSWNICQTLQSYLEQKDDGR
jgi:hypothetical protein